MNDSIPLFEKGENYKPYYYELIFNGESLDIEQAYITEEPINYVWIVDREIYFQTIQYPIKSLVQNFQNIQFPFPFALNTDFEGFSASTFSIAKTAEERLSIFFNFHLNTNDWNYTWSARAHIDTFYVFINDSEFEFSSTGIHYLHPRNDIFQIPIYSVNVSFENDCEMLVSNLIDKCIRIFYNSHKRVLEKYQSSLTNFLLAERFNFPSEVKIACEQYLLYFAEFLKDVGIEVKTRITEEDESVILAVEPKNKEEALENISQLLKLYLQLPISPIVSSYQPASELSFPAQKLQAQVLQLQSQLTLANAERQYKDATIQQQSHLIAQQAQTIQSQQITAQILVDSLQKKEEDEEELVGKIIRVKDYEAGPLAIGLPELLRKLKEIFGSQ